MLFHGKHTHLQKNFLLEEENGLLSLGKSISRRLLMLSIVMSLFAMFSLGASAAKVTLWTASLTPGFNEWVVNEFPKLVAERYPDLEVEVTIGGSRQELEEKRKVATATGVGPDVFHESGGFGMQMANNGEALALDRYVADWDGFSDLVTTQEWEWEGNLYAIPYSLILTGYIRWNDMLAEAGMEAPRDWEELVSMGRTLTKLDGNGNVERVGVYMWDSPTYLGLYPLQLFTEQLGSSLYSEDFRQPNFNSEEGVRALDYARRLYDVAFPGGATPSGSFASRDAVMSFWFGSSHSAGLGNSYSTEELQSAQLDKVPGPEGGPGMTIFNTWGWAVNSKSNQPDNAWKVIETFLDPEVQQSFLTAYGGGGILSPLKSYEYPETDPFADDYRRMAVPPLTTWGPAHPFFGEIVNITTPIILDAVQGKTGISGALEEADRLLSAMFKENGF